MYHEQSVPSPACESYNEKKNQDSACCTSIHEHTFFCRKPLNGFMTCRIGKPSVGSPIACPTQLVENIDPIVLGCECKCSERRQLPLPIVDVQKRRRDGVNCGWLYCVLTRTNTIYKPEETECISTISLDDILFFRSSTFLIGGT